MNAARNHSERSNAIKTALQCADAVLIGAGAGLSASAGLTYGGERFLRYFADFHAKYGINDMYSGGFYPFATLEEYWAWWSRQIYYNRYAVSVGKPYADLLALVKDKNYFVLTTNVDHQFQLAGFEKERLFYTQGDYGLFQCSAGCHNRCYDNEETVLCMVTEQKDMRVPTELIPYCPVCGKPMVPNLRCDDTFVQDDGWYAASARYSDFVRDNRGKKMVLLELGVGGNTPGIIKYPFWQETLRNPKATYVCVNLEHALCPNEIRKQSVCVEQDIGKTLSDLIAL